MRPRLVQEDEYAKILSVRHSLETSRKNAVVVRHADDLQLKMVKYFLTFLRQHRHIRIQQAQQGIRSILESSSDRPPTTRFEQRRDSWRDVRQSIYAPELNHSSSRAYTSIRASCSYSPPILVEELPCRVHPRENHSGQPLESGYLMSSCTVRKIDYLGHL